MLVAAFCSSKNGLRVGSGSGLRHNQIFKVMAFRRQLQWAPGQLPCPMYNVVSTQMHTDVKVTVLVSGSTNTRLK